MILCIQLHIKGSHRVRVWYTITRETVSPMLASSSLLPRGLGTRLVLCMSSSATHSLLEVYSYAPINVMPHFPQVGQMWGYGGELSASTCPRGGAFVHHAITLCGYQCKCPTTPGGEVGGAFDCSRKKKTLKKQIPSKAPSWFGGSLQGICALTLPGGVGFC